MLDSLSLETFQLIWFILVGVLFFFYAVLDGYDLGAGIILPFIKGDTNRRLTLNAVGPVWDCNEVWLIMGGGALFAAFPYVYEGVFSGFYLAFMLLLAILIIRAVCIKLRDKQPMPWWRHGCDTVFSVSSLSAALLIGVTMGNVTRGIPLDAAGNFTGTFPDLLNPYSLLLGVTTITLFAVHGGIYLLIKTEGDLYEQIRRILFPYLGVFTVLMIAHVAVTLIYVPRALQVVDRAPMLYFVMAVAFLCLPALWDFIRHNRAGWALMASCTLMACLMVTFGVIMFPDLIYSLPNPKYSLTLAASATKESLKVMTYIAMIGVPIMLAYSAAIYRVFRGKVKHTLF